MPFLSNEFIHIMVFTYFLLSLMLVAALGLVAIPFWKNRLIGKFLLLSFLVVITASSFYFLSSDQAGLKQWLTHGETHYQLLSELNDLGGLDGMIAKVKIKLKNNPKDAEGWRVLAKLYQMKQDNKNAASAFKKAQELQK